MQNTVQKLNDLMSIIHKFHKVNNKDDVFYDEYEELDNENISPDSFKAFREFENTIAENGLKCIDYFKQCPILDFTIYFWNNTVYCYEKDFYKKLCDIWLQRAPKTPKTLKDDGYYTILEINHYVEAHRDSKK